MAFFTLNIWPNGDIAPCDAIYKPVVLGNIYKDNLADVFNNKIVTSFRLKLLNGKKDSMFGCKECCAPDDVSMEEDELDSAAQFLKEKYQKIMDTIDDK